MDFIHNITEGRSFNIEALRGILDDSLKEKDFFCRKSCRLLNNVGLEKNEALMLLAQYKSKIKYGYDLSISSLSHILRVSKRDKKETSINKLVESPFFLIKACWLYDHAPYFFFYDEGKSEGRNSLIIEFAKQYEADFLKNRVAIDKWRKIINPKRIRSTTFWERGKIPTRTTYWICLSICCHHISCWIC